MALLWQLDGEQKDLVGYVDDCGGGCESDSAASRQIRHYGKHRVKV